MNTKRGSKNAIENRGNESVMTCKICGQNRKPFRVVGNGKSRMAYECNCGLVNKYGDKI